MRTELNRCADDESKSLNIFLHVAKILFPDLVDWPQVAPPGMAEYPVPFRSDWD